MLTKKLFLFFLSMVPVIELRGAIPLGMAWGIPMWQTYLISVIGNILPVPILVVFARRGGFFLLQTKKASPAPCCCRSGDADFLFYKGRSILPPPNTRRPW